MKRLLLSILPIVFLGTISTLSEAAHGTPAKPPPVPLTWSFVIHEDASGNPHGRVYLIAGGKPVLASRHADSQYSVLRRQDYGEHRVPKAALTACTGWWAGQGEDIYAIAKRGRLYLYARETDEMVASSVYHLIKSIPLP